MLIELQLETQKINGQLGQVNDSLNNFGKTIEAQGGKLSRLKETMLGVFAGNVLMQGFTKVEEVIKQSIEYADTYEKTLAKLEAVVANVGTTVGVTSEGLIAQAGALENVSNQTKVTILNSEVLLASFKQVRNEAGKGNDVFNQTIKAGLDLSAVFGTDLNANVTKLGRALSDPIKGMTLLRRTGIIFTQDQQNVIKSLVDSGKAMEAQKYMLQAIEDRYGGAAKAAGDTFPAAVNRAKQHALEFTSALVLQLEPILLSIGKDIAWVIDNTLKPMVDWLAKNKEAVFVFGGIILGAVVAMKAWQAILVVSKIAQEAWAVASALMEGAELASIASTNGLAASMLVLNAIMKANPIGIIVTAVALLAAGFVVLWNHSETFRKVMIDIGKAGIISVGYLIEWFGKLVTAIIKVESGPLRLLLKGLALLHVPGAKEALDGIGKAIDGVGAFFDNAAKSVKGYADNLDSLANKKISIGGTTKPKSGAKTGTVVTDIQDPAAIKAAAAAETKRLADITKAMKDAATIQNDMNTAIADGEKKKAEEFKKHTDNILNITAEYSKKETALTEQYNAEQDQIRKDYADKATALVEAAAQKQKDVIQKSVDELRTAFQSGTALSLADAFKAAPSSGGLIDQLKQKLQGAKDLQANAAALAGKGYSQTFIEEVVKQGPDTGNQMAQAILTASDDATKQLQDLYAQVNNISDNGLNDLATTMNSGGQLATQALMDEFNQVGIDLQQSLAVVNTDLQSALQDSTKKYSDNLAQIHADMADALAAEQKSYLDAISAIDDATTQKLTDLKANLADVIATLNSLNATQAQITQAQANIQAIPNYNGGATINPIPNYSGGSSVVPAVSYNPLTGLIVNNTFNSNGIQSTSQVQDAVVNGIKYGTVVASSPSINTAQGVTNKLNAMGSMMAF